MISLKIPLHHNSIKGHWTRSMANDVVEMWVNAASINPNGFRQPKTGKHAKAYGKPKPTRLERLQDLERKFA